MTGQVAGQVVKQLQRGLAGPMQILQDDQERPVGRQFSQKTGHPLEHTRPLLVQRAWGRDLKPRSPLDPSTGLRTQGKLFPHLWHKPGHLP